MSDYKIFKNKRKNGGKLLSKALTQEGHTPSIGIKPKHQKKNKKKPTN